MMTYAKELINSNRWTNFSVEEYIQCEDEDIPAVEKKGRNQKSECQ